MATGVALVGVGKIARDQHVPSIAASPDWELAATVSRHGRIDGIEAFEDMDAFLEQRPDIEVVSLCLPPVPRYAYAAKAIMAGRHVMLEKPPGATLSECHALESMARKAGVSIYATWHSREAAQVDAARDWLADRRLRSLAVTWKEDVRRWHPGQVWIWQAGGLGVFDPGINALSIVTKILPEPLHLSGSDLFIPENCQTPIAAKLAFAYQDGAEVTADLDFRQQGDQIWQIAIETDAGSLLLSEGGAKLAIDGVSRAETADGNSLTGEYPRLYAHMAELVRSGGIDMDLSPMVHVADAFLLGRHLTVEPFYE